MNRFKGAVFKPAHMVEAMRYSSGLKNFRFDIVETNRFQLDLLFDDKQNFCTALKDRISQVLPTHIAKI